MSISSKMSRRQFVRFAGLTATGALLSACTPPATQTLAPPAKAPPAATPTEVPAVIKLRKVTVQIDGWAVPVTRELLAKPLFMDFTRQTGIEIDFVPRTGTKEAELNRLASAVEAGTSPYDIIDFDESLKQAQDRLAQLAYSIERKRLLAGTLKARI
jgi:hypothetical protein